MIAHGRYRRGGWVRVWRVRLDVDPAWIALPFALDLDKYSPGVHIGPFSVSLHTGNLGL